MEKFGPYTVIQTVRFDNPAWPQFTVMRAGRIIGKSLSALDFGWCEFIERHSELGRYVENQSAPKRFSYRMPSQAAEGARKATRSAKLRRLLAKVG